MVQRNSEKQMKELEVKNREVTSLKKLVKEQSQREREKDRLLKQTDKTRATKQADPGKESKSKMQKTLENKREDIEKVKKEQEEAKETILELRRKLAVLEEGQQESGRMAKRRRLVEECKERTYQRLRMKALAHGEASQVGREDKASSKRKVEEVEEVVEEGDCVPGKRMRLESSGV